MKSEREKQISYINIYIWNLENGIEKFICREGMETDVENGLVDPVGEGKSGMNGESSIDIYTLLNEK